jgi:hypothetical protein
MTFFSLSRSFVPFLFFSELSKDSTMYFWGKEKENKANSHQRHRERKFRAKGRRFQTGPSGGANFDVKLRFFVTCRIGLISTWQVELVVAHLLHSLHDPLVC